MWNPADLAAMLDNARRYSLSLIEAVSPEDWFRQPPLGVTHVAWQVGHLAFAEHRLVLERVRGERSSDASLLPPEYTRLFGRGSIPSPDPRQSPSPTELREVLDRVHEQALRELQNYSPELLSEPVAAAHPMFSDKGGAVQWCAMHELVHAGQIGLLRRLFGQASLR